jgi:hypothetical protein
MARRDRYDVLALSCRVVVSDERRAVFTGILASFRFRLRLFGRKG